MLKADLHLHSFDLPDGVAYTHKQLIDHMASKGFEVIALTNHFRDVYTEELARYAQKKGVLLIRGAELRLQGKDVLIYNEPDISGLRSVSDLKKVKKKSNLIIAPHPYFVLWSCLGDELERYIRLFDAVEYNHFYVRGLNLNKKAEKIAQRYKKPMVGNSDAHTFWQVGYTYTLVDADKTVDSVISAVKKGRVRVVTRPLPYIRFLRRLLMALKTYALMYLRRRKSPKII